MLENTKSFKKPIISLSLFFLLKSVRDGKLCIKKFWKIGRIGKKHGKEISEDFKIYLLSMEEGRQTGSSNWAW
jgi:hypothetical protein